MNVFIDNLFSYSLIICMLRKKTLYLKIEKINCKTLRIIYQSRTHYCDLLERNVSTSIRQWHLQFLLTKIYKIILTPNLRFMCHFSREREVPYNLRKGAVVYLPPARLATRGTNSAHFCGKLIWNQLPS